MPTILIRGVGAELLARVRAYADRKGLSQRDAAERLIDDGLRRHEARQAGGRARQAQMTADDLSRAARARWAKRPEDGVD